MHNSVPYMKTSLCANVELNSTNFDFKLKSSLTPFFHRALQFYNIALFLFQKLCLSHSMSQAYILLCR